jgi:hypothetical protein
LAGHRPQLPIKESRREVNYILELAAWAKRIDWAIAISAHQIGVAVARKAEAPKTAQQALARQIGSPSCRVTAVRHGATPAITICGRG